MAVTVVNPNGHRSLEPVYKGEERIMFSSMQYYIASLLYVVTFSCIMYLHNPYLMIFVTYSLIPFLDSYFSFDLRNPTKEEQKQLEGKLRFKLPLYLAVITEWIFQTWVLYYVTQNRQNLSLFNIIGIMFISGNGSTSNINVAHELFHKTGWLDKFLGTFTLAKNLYMHFTIEHQYGHHRNVSTPDDPATSRYGQTVFEFFPQTIIGSYFSAWKIENNFQRLKGRHPFNPQNKMIIYTILHFVIPYIHYLIFGLYGMFFFLCTAFISVIYLEAINYIEHYGLRREKTEDGHYEKIDIRHSWNAPHRFSNYLLFKLQRHSDHHENGYKEYQTLCSYPDSPTLPHGYTVCVVISFYPPLWFEIMHEVLESYKKEKKSIPLPSIDKKINNYIKKVSLITMTLSVLSFFI
ncbi:hypothetical protein ABPG72_007537 [Tetrahymena utriculariae]